MTDSATSFAVAARARFLPQWQSARVVFLSEQPDLASSVALEFLSRRHCPDVVGPRWPNDLICATCLHARDVMRQLDDGHVIALVIDLGTLPRESLVLLRQLLLWPFRLPIIATGDVHQRELEPLLLEAGCTALLTDLPSDVPLTDWLEQTLSAN